MISVTDMDTVTYIYIIIQPHSLFSTIVYIYLQTDFTPLITAPYPVPLLFHNRKRSSVLMGLRFQVLSYTHYIQTIIISDYYYIDCMYLLHNR